MAVMPEKSKVESETYLQVTRGPYIQLVTSDSARVVWRTMGKIEPVVRYGKRPGRLDKVVPKGAIRVASRAFSDFGFPEGVFITEMMVREAFRAYTLHDETGTYQYEARIEGLESRSVYYYSISDGKTLVAGGDKSYRFCTSPGPGEKTPVQFWIIGNSGTGGLAQAQVYGAMLGYIVERKRPIDFMLHVGELAYSASFIMRFRRFFDPYADMLRSTVCWPSMGSSDNYSVNLFLESFILPAQGEAGGVPSDTKVYYSFDYGRLHCISLDSNAADEDMKKMLRWLDEDLAKAKNEGKTDWVIAFCRNANEAHLPILENRGVDVIFVGGTAIYQRSLLQDGKYIEPKDGDTLHKSPGLNPREGTEVINVGNSGAPLAQVTTTSAKVVAEHGSVIVEIEGDLLKGVMLDKVGIPRDTFCIFKGG